MCPASRSAPRGTPSRHEPAGLRVIGAHRGAAESAHGPRVLVAVIAVQGPGSSRARKYLLRPRRTARPHKSFTSLGRSLRSELPDAGEDRDQRVRDDRKARGRRRRPAGRHECRRRREDATRLRGEARRAEGVRPLRGDGRRPPEVRESGRQGVRRPRRRAERRGPRRRLHAGGKRLQEGLRESGREGDLAGRRGSRAHESLVQRRGELRRVPRRLVRPRPVVQRVLAVMVRRATDPGDSKKGPINAIEPELEMPSHHGPDVQSVLPKLNIQTIALKVPTTLMHVHVVSLDLKKATDEDRIVEVWKRQPRITFVEGGEGVKSTAQIMEMARDLSRNRSDLYEVAVWRDGVHVVDGKRLYYFQAVHQESDVVPENVDAIRALLELEKDGRRSMEKTDRSLGIGLAR